MKMECKVRRCKEKIKRTIGVTVEMMSGGRLLSSGKMEKSNCVS